MNYLIHIFNSFFFENNQELVTLDENLKQNEDLNLKKETYYYNLTYLLSFLLIIILIGYFYNNNLSIFDINNVFKIGHLEQFGINGDIIFRLSGEISKSSTVRGWDIIHEILKKMNKNNINKVDIINELETLKKLNLESPGIFSLHSESFEKSLTKLIDFLNEIL